MHVFRNKWVDIGNFKELYTRIKYILDIHLLFSRTYDTLDGLQYL